MCCSWRLVLPSFSSSCRKTNDDNTRYISEDHLWFSKNKKTLIYSRYTSMTVKNPFLRHFWMFSCFNIGPSSFTKRYSSCGWAGRFSSLWFCYGLRSACKITRIESKRIFFELHFWGFHQLVDVMWNSDQWELSLLVDKILISTPYLPCKQQVLTSITGLILVFPRIHPIVCDVESSLGRVSSQKATALIQNLLNLSCCDGFSSRSTYCCIRRSLRARSSQSYSTLALIMLGSNEELDCPITKGRSILSWKGWYTSHISAKAP